MLWLAAHLGFVVSLAAGAFVVGRRLIARLPSGSAAEEAAFATALGLGVFSHLELALGLAGQLRLVPVLIGLGALVLACVLPWRALRRPRITWVSAGLFGATALLVVLALYPSTAWDANAYHLPAASWFVGHHRVTPAVAVRYAAFPQTNELLFALGFLFGGDAQPAQLVEALFCAITALALYAAGRRRSERAGAWAAALWLGSPLVLRLGSTAYIDVSLAAYGTLSVLALDRWIADRRRGWLLLAAAFAGFAASSKYLGLFFVAVVGVTVLARVIGKQATLADLAAAAGVSLVVCGPWYGYVTWATGNPVFPFLGRVFGYGSWNAVDLARQMDEMRSHGIGHSLVAALTLPFRLAFAQRPFFPELPVSPLPWIGLAPIAWVARRDREVRRWALIALAWVACWFAGIQLYRYLLAALPLLSLAAGASMAELIPARRRWTAPAIAAALLALGPAWAAWELYGRGLPPTTVEQQSAWLDARMPAHKAVRFAADAAHGERVYQLELEDYVAFAGPDVVGDWFGPWRYLRLLDRLGDPDGFVSELEATGARWLVAPLPAFRGAVKIPPHPRLVQRYADVDAVVYELNP